MVGYLSPFLLHSLTSQFLEVDKMGQFVCLHKHTSLFS
nr:MAG TPA: hypothetical protein [Caudoviricetes sp.]DAK87633.1 MAG TPA: hypothetical protein [Bacteriophage sp.]